MLRNLSKRPKCISILSINFVVLFASLLHSAEPFLDVKVARKHIHIDMADEAAFSIDFAWQDELAYLQCEPGDLVELKRPGRFHQRRRIYSPTKFPTEKDPTVQITIEMTRENSGKRLGYSRMSDRLFKSTVGNEEFQLRVLKTALSKALLEKPTILIAGGWAITRVVGIALYLESKGHPFLVLHSQRLGKTSQHQAYLDELQNKGSYLAYLTGKGLLRMNEVQDDIPTFFSEWLNSLDPRYLLNAHFVLSGPDSSEHGPGDFEISLSQELQQSGIPEDQIFLSTWSEE